MDRGLTIENPYASVTIPQAQLKDSFLRFYLGEDLTSNTVLFNPSILPTYSAAPEKEVAAGPRPPSLAWNGQEGQAQEELQARPTNPYASLRMPRVDALESFYWNIHKETTLDPGNDCCSCCSPCCAKCSPCCRKCCCIIS